MGKEVKEEVTASVLCGDTVTSCRPLRTANQLIGIIVRQIETQVNNIIRTVDSAQ